MSNSINLHYTKAYPRPSDGVLTGAAPDGSDIVGASKSFSPLRVIEFSLITNEDTGRLHGGILYSNILDSRYKHTVYLQPKELSDANILFLKKFWSADFKYIEFPTAGTGFNNVRQVVTEGGKLPMQRINDNRYLSDLTLELTEVMPNAI
jgi:hypothetical protein